MVNEKSPLTCERAFTEMMDIKKKTDAQITVFLSQLRILVAAWL